MPEIKKIFKKTLESFPEIRASMQYDENKIAGICIKKEGYKKYTIYIGFLGKALIKHANEDELTGIIAHELSHGLTEEEGTAILLPYISEQERLKDDIIADEKAAERGYKEQVLAALNLTKKMYVDCTGDMESRIKNLIGA